MFDGGLEAFYGADTTAAINLIAADKNQASAGAVACGSRPIRPRKYDDAMVHIARILIVSGLHKTYDIRENTRPAFRAHFANLQLRSEPPQQRVRPYMLGYVTFSPTRVATSVRARVESHASPFPNC
jgi:hypothetical protein